ncbi:TetR/AcrR family transcriptional regulator [Aquihabitans sp. G128]|uniref:TetR/AcrR family transcriptional regulator n=1 Tax=Aquihabitans sp. G128 TaxID=2849779 RepID=UPI001C242D3B|nr:TetR/AcrR family transcriptional regulator [Aquihabitans sp. G128]QXC63159.1 TetR/AcrR family transcriptional regulator [Aquihabitans sp. G128]
MPTQEERRSSTRARLLEAAADVLVEAGATGFTTTAVAERAGVSQGAVFKHFATKADLLAATVASIFAGLVARYEGQFVASDAAAAPADRLGAGLDLLWEIFQDERLLAAYDLFTAARTDADLQADLQPVVRAHVANLHALAELLFADLLVDDVDRLHDAVDLAAATMQGLVVNRVAVAAPETEARVLAMLRHWVADRLALRQEAGR